MAVTLSPKAFTDLHKIAAQVPKDAVAAAPVRDLDRVVQRLFESAGTKAGLRRDELSALVRELELFLRPVFNYAASGKGADSIRPAQELAQVLGLTFPVGTDEAGMFPHAMGAMRRGIDSAASAGLASRWADVDR